MKAKGAQFHPSRDKGKGPSEYELPYGGNEGVNFTGFGYAEKGELEHYDRMYKEDPSNYPEMDPIMKPVQGRMFDPAKVEGANRAKLARQRLQTEDDSTDPAMVIREQAMLHSTVPTSHLQSRPGRGETYLTASNSGMPWQGSGAAGWYRGPAVPGGRSDVIAVDPSLKRPEDTLIHEMGHRRHLGEMGQNAEEISHPKRRHPDPLKEGAADAYEDRYGGPQASQVRAMSRDIDEGYGKFGSYQFTGYSTDPTSSMQRGWNDSDRAIYAATRAHGSETGELAHYKPQGRHVMEDPERVDFSPEYIMSGRGNPTSDATLHSLLSAGPHAKQALRQTGLKEVGAQAYRRHQDRQLLTQGQAVQGALFNELRGTESGKLGGYMSNPDAVVSHQGTSRERIEGYKHELGAAEAHLGGEQVVPQHMSHNQFGEAPRSAGDVRSSLGVKKEHAKSRGFT